MNIWYLVIAIVIVQYLHTDNHSNARPSLGWRRHLDDPLCLPPVIRHHDPNDVIHLLGVCEAH